MHWGVINVQSPSQRLVECCDDCSFWGNIGIEDHFPINETPIRLSDNYCMVFDVIYASPNQQKHHIR